MDNKNIIKKKIDYYNLNKFIKIINNKYNPYPYLRHSDLFVLSSKFFELLNLLKMLLSYPTMLPHNHGFIPSLTQKMN